VFFTKYHYGNQIMNAKMGGGDVVNRESEQRILVGKPEWKRYAGRCRYKQEDDIKMDMGSESVNWTW
jgi:hypothetical protein